MMNVKMLVLMAVFASNFLYGMSISGVLFQTEALRKKGHFFATYFSLISSEDGNFERKERNGGLWQCVVRRSLVKDTNLVFNVAMQGPMTTLWSCVSSSAGGEYQLYSYKAGNITRMEEGNRDLGNYRIYQLDDEEHLSAYLEVTNSIPIGPIQVFSHGEWKETTNAPSFRMR